MDYYVYGAKYVTPQPSCHLNLDLSIATFDAAPDYAVQAFLCYHAYMTSKAMKQYTIRNVPRSVDQALRKKAHAESKSLNSLLLEAIAKEAGISGEPAAHSDLDSLIGTWVTDPETEKALQEQRALHPRDWEPAPWRAAEKGPRKK